MPNDGAIEILKEEVRRLEDKISRINDLPRKEEEIQTEQELPSEVKIGNNERENVERKLVDPVEMRDLCLNTESALDLKGSMMNMNALIENRNIKGTINSGAPFLRFWLILEQCRTQNKNVVIFMILP